MTNLLLAALTVCLLSLAQPAGAAYNSSLFWSYYGGGAGGGPVSVERGHLTGDGYSRHSPHTWQGRHLSDQADLSESQENEIEPRDKILLLGALSKISHGPRKKRSVFPVYYPDYPSAKADLQNLQKPLEAFRSFLSQWPVKQSGSGTEHGNPRQIDYQEIYQQHYRKFRQDQKEERAVSRADCRYACSPGDGLDVPCCPELQGVYSIGPFVQPSLLENWVTGVFQFAANNAVIFTFIKSLVLVGAFGVVALLWGFLGESLGLIELPRARFYDASAEVEEERLVLEVLDGNWLSTLEDHVRARGDQLVGPYYDCCVSEDTLECFPHRTKNIRTQPTFRCTSAYKYNISLNVNSL